MRELLGDRFAKFIDHVYTHLPNDVFKNIADAAVHKYGGDFRISTEEYLAGLAERFARGENVSAIKKVLYSIRDVIEAALKKLGIEPGFKMSDNYLMYVLWRSKQHLEDRSDIMAHISDISMRRVLNIDNDAVLPKTLFREVDDIEDITNTEEARRYYDARVKSVSYRALR